MIKYIGKVLQPMSVLEIIIYALLGTIVVGILFKWFIYDPFIKPKRKKRNKVKNNEEEE